jgi:hypothetical protein
MSPPFISTVAETAEALAVALNRGPAPQYVPVPGPTDIPETDALWDKVTGLREQAWKLGITQGELDELDFGGCRDQLTRQALGLERFIAKSKGGES